MNTISRDDFVNLIKDMPIRKLAVSIAYNNTNQNTLNLCSLACCESPYRELMVRLHMNTTNVTSLYDPISMYKRSCLFVTPDSLNQERIAQVLEVPNAVYVDYDMNGNDSPIDRFKDTPIEDMLFQSDEPTNVVIVFRPKRIRDHVHRLCNSYEGFGTNSESGKNKKSKKQEVIDKYINGLSFKGIWFIIVLAALFLVFSLVFGVDDMGLGEPIEVANPSNVYEPE